MPADCLALRSPPWQSLRMPSFGGQAQSHLSEFAELACAPAAAKAISQVLRVGAPETTEQSGSNFSVRRTTKLGPSVSEGARLHLRNSRNLVPDVQPCTFGTSRFRRCKVARPEQDFCCSGRATLHLRNSPSLCPSRPLLPSPLSPLAQFSPSRSSSLPAPFSSPLLPASLPEVQAPPSRPPPLSRSREGCPLARDAPALPPPRSSRPGHTQAISQARPGRCWGEDAASTGGSGRQGPVVSRPGPQAHPP